MNLGMNSVKPDPEDGAYYWVLPAKTPGVPVPVWEIALYSDRHWYACGEENSFHPAEIGSKIPPLSLTTVEGGSWPHPGRICPYCRRETCTPNCMGQQYR